MNGIDPPEEPNLNTGMPWSSWDDRDIRWGLDHNQPVEEIADFLCRTPSEVRQRISEIAEADAVGDPSWLSDGLAPRDRVALETYRDARDALALIREAVEDCAPPGSVAREKYLAREFTVQAEALVRGIYAIAERSRCGCGHRDGTNSNSETAVSRTGRRSQRGLSDSQDRDRPE